MEINIYTSHLTILFHDSNIVISAFDLGFQKLKYEANWLLYELLKIKELNMDHILPFRIFAVDPASGKSGWAVLDVLSLYPLRVQIVATGQLDGDKLFRTRKEMFKTFKKQYCVLDCLYDEYCDLLKRYEPMYVVSEGAFGYVHLSAFISISFAIHTLRRAAHTILYKDPIEIPPTISKKAFTGHGAADKDMMRLAFNMTEILDKSMLTEEISEHEVDAVAHGIGFIRRDVIGDVEQISAKDKKKKKK